MNNPIAIDKQSGTLAGNGRYARVLAALMETDPQRKCEAARQLWLDWRANRLIAERHASPIRRLEVPGRPLYPVLVPPRELPRRRLGTLEGRAALAHAVAHIEFNAINLALDAVYRFRQMPNAFAGDWLRIAAEEARHFGLLQECLAAMGKAYGDFPAHNGLWEMACKTDHDVLLRMALVPRVLEARGLDVTPGMIERLRAAGDQAIVAALEVILREEIDHVATGSRWYVCLCHERGLEPEGIFRELVSRYAPGHVQGPFHVQARLAAGFSETELANLESLPHAHR